LVLTTGFASAESQLGADQTVYAPQSSVVDVTFDVGSSFDGNSSFEKSTLPSVEIDVDLDAGFAGPR
ncbi:MAG: hypothetical protein ABJL43_16630, partial [Maribacter dokdonensis]|uniref:hypothetical protein n=1 Tax=Maribacter dokdonensis TaxID=320912 RepID=UPI00329A14E0